MCWMALLSVAVSAQDFASRFLTEHKGDSNLTCVTISPKMMEEIMKSDAEKDDEILEIISLKQKTLVCKLLPDHHMYLCKHHNYNPKPHRQKWYVVLYRPVKTSQQQLQQL